MIQAQFARCVWCCQTVQAPFILSEIGSVICFKCSKKKSRSARESQAEHQKGQEGNMVPAPRDNSISADKTRAEKPI